jgi:hypothetical protein
MTTPKTGPLTTDEIRALWVGVVDKSYSEPLVRAGEGQGLEVYSQLWEVLARASRAVDTTTQAMFILPASGQTAAPAAGAAKATVTLTFRRTLLLERPLRVAAGTMLVGERIVDWGPLGGEDHLTGRRYMLVQDLLFHPGDMGPLSVLAHAEVFGMGHNNPMPGTIVDIPQPGAEFENDLATVTTFGPLALVAPIVARASIQTPNEADMFVPEHIGQQVTFTAGSNLNRTARIKQFYPPDLTVMPPLGSRVDLEITQSVDGTTFAGTFSGVEEANLTNGGPAFARVRIFGERIVSGRKRLTYDVLRGDFSLVTPGLTVFTGVASGATLTVAALLYPQLFTAEVATASWRILDWAADFGLTVTNALSPTGGLAGWLDELGGERNIDRAPGESDDIYRQRVARIADVVTPNAIRRALSRTLGVLPWCFREVGTAEFRGWFFDGDLATVGTSTTLTIAGRQDAYDTDVIRFPGVLTSGTFVATPGDNERVVLEETATLAVKALGWFGSIAGGVLTFVRREGSLPASLVGHRIRGLHSGAIWTPASGSVPATVNERRWRVWLNLAEFRGFFLVGVPPLGVDDIGLPYDTGPHGAYDAAPYDDFYDGYSPTAADVYRSVYHAVDTVRAGGVAFDLYVERIGCP